jgi:ATPases with chaperone activity, ATP-binding subunit
MFMFEIDTEVYPLLVQYTTPVKKPVRPIVGRDLQMKQALAAFVRPELCNVLLIAPAGSGKTAFVQGLAQRDSKHIYLEVDLSKMISNLNDPNEMAAILKALFEQAAKYSNAEDKPIVLFMDEFHQVVQLSDAAVEALKPLLADSGTRDIRVMVASTFEEFRKFISPNQALVERLQRIVLPEADKAMTVAILKDMAKTYNVASQFYNDSLFELIYEYTNRYIPANAQPRKSILILDAMVGWHRFDGSPMDKKLLTDVIEQSEGVHIDIHIDAHEVKEYLDSKVFAQKFATSSIEQRLNICAADLNDKTKPLSTMLFTGSSGTGKLIADYEPVPVYVDGNVRIKKHGDLKPGDVVFGRKGQPETVLGIFPHKDVDMYRVHLSDGRTLDVGDEHLWTVYTLKQRQSYKGDYSRCKLSVMSTKEILNNDLHYVRPDGRKNMKYYIPMNEAVQWDELDYAVDPYVLGVAIGDGCLTESVFTISGNDPEIIDTVAKSLGAIGVYNHKGTYSHNFYLPLDMRKGHVKLFQTRDVLSDARALFGCYSKDRRIPKKYMYGSIEQRWRLIQGLFDTDGTISADDRTRVTYSTFSKGLAEDISSVLFSLGVPNTINHYVRYRKDGEQARKQEEYVVRVKSIDEDKSRFFTLSRKLDVLAAHKRTDKVRVKDFAMVGISDIEYIGKQSAQCIYVQDDEHLYLAGQYVVTHNTAVTKALAEKIFGSEKSMIRFDMTEYALADSLERFRDELTTRIWEKPHSIVLLDEIEKACAPVTRILLQVLDDGRLSDRNGRETSFQNCYIIMTTNAASEIYKTVADYGEDDEGTGAALREYGKLIRRSIRSTTGDNRFPPELLGRIDTIVPFNPLSRDTMKKIAEYKLKNLRSEVLKKHRVDVKYDMDKLVRYIVFDKSTTDSDAGGARAINSCIDTEVVVAVAKYINEHPYETKLFVGVEGDLQIDNKDKLKSDAYIVVKGVR